MKTKLIKIILLLLIILIFSNSMVVYADFADPTTGYNNYNPNQVSQSSDKFKGKVDKLFGVINVIGIVCSVIALTIIGLRYMLGSVEARAEYKKTMLGYIIGVVILATATTIPNIIYNFGIKFSEEQKTLDNNSSITLPNGNEITVQ